MIEASQCDDTTAQQSMIILTIYILVQNCTNTFNFTNKINRLDTYRALNHPWITRNPKDEIPLTMMEAYSKSDLITSFQNVSKFSYFYKNAKILKFKNFLTIYIVNFSFSLPFPS